MMHFPSRFRVRVTATLLIAVILGTTLFGAVLFAATKPGGSSGGGKSVASAPGMAAAEAVSAITGIAISPLLGVGAVGAWHYFKAPDDQRAQLSWYAQPWFWLPALALVGLCFFKDTFAPVVPTALKKPLDVAEVFENKVSALIATGALVPILGVLYRTVSSDSALAGSGLAAIDGGSVFSVLMAPIAFTAFVVVWLASHVINVLILISPFGTVDLALKAFRTFLLGTVAVSSFSSPKAGAIWAGVLILICYALAGWSFRIFIFGTVFSWDIFTLRRKRFDPAPDKAWAFLAREVEKTPIRTYGKLAARPGGGIVFAYKPWLVMQERKIELAEGEWRVGRGVVYPEIQERCGDDFRTLFKLPPRYKSHEAAVAKACGLGTVDDIGLRAAWRWLKELFGFRSRPASVGA